ncbi:PIR protein, putative [Plasmodium sp.]|nr:PIR protein, putative [Plasmodium sp.]
MKLHYTIIFLFFLLLNILSHNKNKSYITIHTPITTSRVLIECNVYIPNYDNDPDMNSVRENFHKQTEQRFHEYDKRMIKNRQKCKEKCDKDIQQIIVKDKIQKSLEEKVEKGCLKCGFGLGGVAVGVGLLGTAVVNELKRAALAASIETAIASCEAKGAVAGHAAGVAKFIDGLKALSIEKLIIERLETFYTTTPFTESSKLPIVIHQQYQATCSSLSSTSNPICGNIASKLNLVAEAGGTYVKTESIIAGKLNVVVTQAKEVAEAAAETATGNVMEGAIKTNIALVDAKYASCQIAIIASVVAILIYNTRIL